MESPETGKQNDGEDEKTFKKLLVKFMGYTSAHGIGRLAESKTIFWKIFWSLVCLGAFGMFAYQAHGLFVLYLSRPVSTSVKVTFEKSLPFPAVTICNLNMIRKDSIPSTVQKALKEKFDYVVNSGSGDENGSGSDGSGFGGESDDEGQSRRRRFAGSGNSGSQPTVDPHYNDDAYQKYRNDASNDGSGDSYDGSGSEDIDDEYPNPSEIDPTTKLRVEVALLVGSMDSEDLYDNGHLFHDMIVNCSWKGVNCASGNNSRYWTQSWNYKYGNCYTFNGGYDSNGKPVRILKSTKPGPSQGLIIHINIQQSLYVGALTLEAGVRVVLHDQGHMPFPYERGFSVSPGMATSIGLKKTLIQRLDRFKNKSCLPENELPVENIYRRFKNITRYSPQACLNSCLGLSQLFRCNCSEDAYPSKGEPCNIFDPVVASCLKVVKSQFNADRLKCLGDCRQPCKEEVIQKTISSSQWPSTAYLKYLSSQLEEAQLNESDNHLLLNVFYNELNYEKIEESYSYGDINLLADIGGQLGLWIGISVLTCCEVLELIMKFFSHIIKKCNRAAEAQVGDVPPHGYR